MLIGELRQRGKGRLLEVAQLIEQGANVNCKDYRGFTPIYFGEFYCSFSFRLISTSAAISNRLECVKSLISAGAKLNYQYGTPLNSLLHLAVKSSNVELIESLLRYGEKLTYILLRWNVKWQHRSQTDES